jgi:hypothetical protein
MATSYFKFNTLSETSNKIKNYIQEIDREKIYSYYAQSKHVIIVTVTAMVGLFVFVSNQMHKLLKQSIVACRYIADQLERADQGLEYLKQTNQSLFVSTDPVSYQTSTASPDLASLLQDQVNELCTQYTNSQLRNLTGIKSKISKQKLAEAYCSLLL